jgi:hypothetical protein
MPKFFITRSAQNGDFMKRCLLIILFFMYSTIWAQNAIIKQFVNNNFWLPINYRNINSLLSVSGIKRNMVTGDIVHFQINNNNIKHLPNTGDFVIGKKYDANSGFIAEYDDTLFNIGTFEYNITLSGSQIDNSGAEILTKKTRKYTVIIDYPQLASPDVDRDTLFIGEYFKFSIAAIEYDDTSKYKYEIKFKDVATVVTGKYIIDLSKYLVPENEGKNIQITAYYNSHPFRYYNNAVKDTASTWSFYIAKPVLVNLGRWTKDDKVVLIDNPKYEIIKLFYEGVNKNKTITIVPQNYRVDNFNTSNSNVFRGISCNVNTNVIDVVLDINRNQVEVGQLVQGSFSFDFVTEIGTNRIQSDPGTSLYRAR